MSTCVAPLYRLFPGHRPGADNGWILLWDTDFEASLISEALRGVVADHYWTVTLRPWQAEGSGATSFRLYLGATPEDPVEGMFSFVPCLPAEGASDLRFPRSEVQLPGVITSHLRQGKKTTKLAEPHDAATIWSQVAEQVDRNRRSEGWMTLRFACG